MSSYFIRYFNVKVCHYLPGDMRIRGYNEKVTNGNTGVGGFKMWHFCGDIIFEWPLNTAPILC